MNHLECVTSYTAAGPIAIPSPVAKHEFGVAVAAHLSDYTISSAPEQGIATCWEGCRGQAGRWGSAFRHGVSVLS